MVQMNDDLKTAIAQAHAIQGLELVGLLGTDADNGLDSAEVEQRRLRWGANRLQQQVGPSLALRFLRQFNNPLLITLLLAGGVKCLFGHPRDALVIISVTVVNALIGTVQESKAESAIAALASSVNTVAEVVRDGQWQRINSECLVPGDVIRLAPGDKLPADLRLLVTRELRVDESALTGESDPVSKGVKPVLVEERLPDRVSMAYAGTFVTAGQGQGIVVQIGDATELGAISQSLQQQVDLSTPLTRKFVRFSHTLLKLIVLLAALTFGVGVARGFGIEQMFDAAVALAVGAIPEELPGIVTIALAIGVARMARCRAIIRRLPAVETLGSTTVICSDKTGTLTQNRMTVKHLYAGGCLLALEDLWPQDIVNENASPAPLDLNLAMEETLLAGLLCNDARVSSEEGFVGDPTETALLAVADAMGLDLGLAHRDHPRRDVIPFDSELQFMATLHGSERILVKGSIEVVLNRCDGALNARGEVRPLERDAITEAVSQMAGRGERVLAFAIGSATPGQDRLQHHHVSGALTFIGLQGMKDPPRPEAIRAVADCQNAGIRIKLITGDHPETALAIAEQMGIVSSPTPRSQGEPWPRVLDGRQLEAWPKEHWSELVDRVHVFARVTPAQKLELVAALQANGEVVAMTGDGVNDAPALKQADIGVAMGRGGTEVARQAADMLLTDDNFATIKAAVEAGRTVDANLRKTMAFVLPVNGGASMTILFGAILATPLPITALQVLWLNMVCSLAMSIALAFEPACSGVMHQPPRPPAQPLLTPELIRRIGVVSLFNWVVIFTVFLWVHQRSGDLAVARTMAVQALVLAHLVYLVCISHWRERLQRWQVVHWRMLRSAPAVPLGIAATICLQVVFSQNPWMNAVLATHPLSLPQWGLCALPMLFMLPLAVMVERLDPLPR